jgi:hypothetical protein
VAKIEFEVSALVSHGAVFLSGLHPSRERRPEWVAFFLGLVRCWLQISLSQQQWTKHIRMLKPPITPAMAQQHWAMAPLVKVRASDVCWVMAEWRLHCFAPMGVSWIVEG